MRLQLYHHLITLVVHIDLGTLTLEYQIVAENYSDFFFFDGLVMNQ